MTLFQYMSPTLIWTWTTGTSIALLLATRNITTEKIPTQKEKTTEKILALAAIFLILLPTTWNTPILLAVWIPPYAYIAAKEVKKETKK